LVAWTGITSAVIFIVLKSTMGLRVSAEDERVGLDASEFAQPGYVIEGAVVEGGHSPAMPLSA
ncbi:MAG: ammonium transporter, partial [Dehalococcoidia bacterium]|nr:ammonium transporter [Dehalococcoidia bacterium]